MNRTKGISPKAILAFCFPAIASIGGAVTTWIVTGHLDEEAIRVAAGGLVTSHSRSSGRTSARPVRPCPRAKR